MNQLYRDLQVALFALEQAPDFRRVASFAVRARPVPANLRIRQFQRFRPRLVQHFSSRLQAGTDERVLLESLRALLSALGVAEFEADYFRTEVERRRSTAAPVARTYDQELRTLQEEHDRRMRTIRDLAQLDEEIREQLLEAERERFRETVMGLNDGSAAQAQRR